MKKGGRDVCAFSSCFFSLQDKAEIIKMEAMRGRKRVNEIREGELTRMRVNDEEENELFISSFFISIFSLCQFDARETQLRKWATEN